MLILMGLRVRVPLSQMLSVREMKLGFFQFSATFFTTNSAVLLSYPMMVIMKSAKILPVMFFGLFRGVYKFNFQRIFMAVTITIGLLLFSFDKVKDAHMDSMKGMACAFAALFFDGMVGSSTDKDKGKGKESKGMAVGYSVMFNSFTIQTLFNVIAYIGEVLLHDNQDYVAIIANENGLLLRLIAMGFAGALG